MARYTAQRTRVVRVREEVYNLLRDYAENHPIRPSLTHLLSIIVWEWANSKDLKTLLEKHNLKYPA